MWTGVGCFSVSGNASFVGELYSAQSQVWTSSPMSVTERDALKDRRRFDHVPERDTTGGHSLEKTQGFDGSVLSKWVLFVHLSGLIERDYSESFHRSIFLQKTA